LTRTTVDPVLCLSASEAPRRIDVVADGRSPEFDGTLENPPGDRRNPLRIGRASNRAGSRREGMHTGAMKDLVGIDVSDAGDDGLIKQQRLDRSHRPRTGVCEIGGLHVEGVRTETPPRDGAQKIERRVRRHASESAWIDEEQHPGAFVPPQAPSSMHMRKSSKRSTSLRRYQQKPSAHAEMKGERSTVVDLEGETLSATVDRRDFSTRKQKGRRLSRPGSDRARGRPTRGMRNEHLRVPQ